jgi:outer membrane receptor protein involved in Fe transport
MNRTLARLRALAVVSALGIALVHSRGFAQEATPAPAATQDQNAPVPVTTTAGTSDQEVLVLSPFVVEADEDTGYAATSTLAGTRIKTNLKDVGDAISVVTKKFLQDTDSNNSEDLLVYTTNTEVGGQGGNFAGLGGSASLNTQSAQESPQTNTRVRGLASADNTRNYFLTDIPWDSYNTDRIDIQRGPNSILFGLGSPAGIINASVNDANLGKDAGSLENRFGSFGSVRNSLDYNKVILPDELAVRIDILDDDTDYSQKPAFNDSRRYFGALRWDPKILNQGSAHTDIRVSFENGTIDANNPSQLPPGDEITPWFTNMNQPLYGYNSMSFNSTHQPIYDGSNPFTGTYVNVLSNPLYGARYANTYNDTAGNSFTNPNFSPFLSNNSVPNGPFNGIAQLAFPQPNSSLPGGPNNGWLTPNANEAYGPPGSGSSAVVQGLSLGSMGGITDYANIAVFENLPNSNLGLYKDRSITNPSIFDFYNTDIVGPNNTNDQNWNAFDAAVSETFFNGKVGIEAVVDHQEFTRFDTSAYGGNPALSIDDMATLAGDASLNDPANPNAGRAAIGGAAYNPPGSADFYQSKRDDFRLTAYADLDFSDYFDKSSWISRIFGHHVFTGLWNKETEKQFSYGINGAVGDSELDDLLLSQGEGYGQIAYLSPSLAGKTLGTNLGISGVTAIQNIGPVATIQLFNLTPNPANSGPIQTTSPLAANYSGNPFSYLGYTAQNFQVQSWQDGDPTYGGGNRDIATVESRALVWQGFMLDDIVVPTIGWRSDSATDQNAGITPQTELPNASGGGRYYNPFDPSWTVSTGPNDPRNGTNDVSFNSVSGHSTSYSVVIHTPKWIKSRMPLQTDVSLLFDQSSNFQPAAGRYDISGDPIAAPSGKTTEKGFVITTLNDRLTLKVNWYKTSITNGSLGNGGGVGGVYEVGYAYGWGDIMGKWALDGPGNPNNWMFTTNFNVSTATATQGQLIDPNLPASAAGTPHFLAYQPNPGQTVDSEYNDQQLVINNFLAPANQPSAQFQSYWSIVPVGQLDTNHNGVFYSPTQPGNFIISDDTLSKGVEYELTAQPVKGWDLTFNAAHTYATVQDVAGSFTEFVQNEENFFHTPVQGADNGELAGDVREWNGYINGQTAGNTFDTQFWGNYLYQKSLTGTGVSEERPWRFNIISNYEFQTGVLKNVNLGVSYRWQDKEVVGYPFANGTFETNHPYLSPVVDTWDGWVGYQRKLTNKIKWRIQLNVRNLFYSATLIPITVQPDGSPGEYRIPEPRTWEVTNSLTF